MKKILIVFVGIFLVMGIVLCCYDYRKLQSPIAVLEVKKEKMIESKESDVKTTSTLPENKSNTSNDEMDVDTKNNTSNIITTPPADLPATSNNELPVSTTTTPTKVNPPKKIDSNDSQVVTNNTTPKNDLPQIEDADSGKTEMGGILTTYHDSITGGKKEFSSECEALARGKEIIKKELDEVILYNKEHPETPKQPLIDRFRVYVSVIDEDGKSWYYLHFFCSDNVDRDEELKSKY